MGVTSWIRRQFNNAVITTAQLNAPLASGVTSTFTVGSGQGSTFPDGSIGSFIVDIDQGTSTEEKILCSSRSGDTFTIASSGRGYNGYSAQNHSSGAFVLHTIDAQDLDEANQVAHQTLGAISASGDLLVGSSANNLTRLARGAANTFLQTVGSTLQWTGFGVSESQPVGASNADGVQTTPARSDHAHAGVGTFNTRTGSVTLTAADVEALFSADQQILSGTGSGTGEIIDLLTALKEYFASAGQLIVGTGANTGELLAKGSAGTVLYVGGADSSGLEWVIPLTANPAGHATQGTQQAMGVSFLTVTNTASDYLYGGVTYASNKFTVPTAGLYLCTANLEFDSASVSAFQCGLVKNGTQISASTRTTQQTVASTSEISVTVTDTVQCAANDTLTWGGVSSAGAVNTFVGSNRCSMSIAMVSA